MASALHPRTTILAILAIILSTYGAYYASTLLPSVPQVYAANRAITLVGFISAWNETTNPNPSITVFQGDTVTIQLSSGDGATHRFFIDVDNNGPTPDCPGVDICSSNFPPSTTLTFTVTIATGVYTYYCSIHPTTMLGSFIVQPASTVGGTIAPVNKLNLLVPFIGALSTIVLAVALSLVYLRHTRRTRRKLSSPTRSQY